MNVDDALDVADQGGVAPWPAVHALTVLAHEVRRLREELEHARDKATDPEIRVAATARHILGGMP